MNEEIQSLMEEFENNGNILSLELFLKAKPHDELLREFIRKSFDKDPVLTIMECSQERTIEFDDINVKTLADSIIEHSDTFANIGGGSKYYDLAIYSALLNMLNKHPQVFEKVIEEDYEAALKLLSVLNLEEASAHLKKTITTKLIEHKWVPTPESNNLNLIKWLFAQSMKNNPAYTLEVMKSSINIDEIRSQYTPNKKEFDAMMIDVLLKGHEEAVEAILHFANEDASILTEALKCDFDQCVYSVTEYLMGEKNQYTLGASNKRNGKYFDKYFKGKKFVLSKESRNLCYVSSEFIMESLRNDYERTIECLSDVKTPYFAEFNLEQAKEVLKLSKRKRASTEQISLLFSKNPGLFAQMVKVDRKFAEECLKCMTLKALSQRDAKFIIDTIGIENINFKEHPEYGVLLGKYIFINNSSKPQYKSIVVKNGMPFSLCPVKNIDDVRFYEENEEVLDFYKKVVFNPSTYEYNQRDEKEILRLLGSQCQTIEEELALWHQNGLRRSDMTPTQMLGLALFIKKDHHFKGLDGMGMNLFIYSDATTLGEFSRMYNSIFLYNGGNETIEEILSTIVHEDNHAKQHQNVKRCDARSDNLIAAYSKDELLRMFMSEFYNENYSAISIEYDAESKALMEIAHILQLEGVLNEDGRIDEDSLFDGALIKNEETNRYILDGLRRYRENGKQHCELLGVLFDKYLPEMLESGKVSIEEIERDYPIIAYEYDLTIQPAKKISGKKLLQNYLSSSGKDKDIYLSLIKHRLDSTYNANTGEFAEFVLDYMQENNIEDPILKDCAELERVISFTVAGTAHRFNQSLLQIDNYLQYAKKIIDERVRRASQEEVMERNER